jgi:hypothetical protein
MSICRQNFTTETEEALNKQINAELKVSPVLHAIIAYFLYTLFPLCDLFYIFIFLSLSDISLP